MRQNGTPLVEPKAASMTSDETGVGGKCGMRKEGHELVGMKERTEGQSIGGGAGVMLPPPVLAL